MSGRCLFVTGTDTGVGKTTLCRALLRAWRQLGVGVAALKPLETGCAEALAGSDAALLAAAAGIPADAAALLRFALPVAPEAAARAAGSAIDAAALLHGCRQRAAGDLLVEGAGGLLVPIAPGYTMADLADALDATVLIVARARLGTINHALLTVAECQRRGRPVAAVILNRSDEAPGPDDAENAALIAAHGGVPVYGPFPHLPGADDDALAAAARACLPLMPLRAAFAAAAGKAL